VSRPRSDRLCLDLGHKAVAADPSGPRVYFPDLPDARIIGQNEEHLIIETPQAHEIPLGTPLLGIPTHICPTCALHRRAYIVADGMLVDEWEVTARDRVLGI
jgi:D-serine deaminase-like pyridoxal phosphate-dependent protein